MDGRDDGGSWAPPRDWATPTLPPPPQPTRKTRRPAWSVVAIVGVVLRVADDQLWRVAVALWGPAGIIAVPVVGVLIPLLYAASNRRRAARRGSEFTLDEVQAQVADSGLTPPAFAEDGTVLGASVLVVNQRTKVLELNTEYELFGWDGQRLGAVRQVGQSFGKYAARLFTAFDQFFTHRFEIVDAADGIVLRVTRPAKFLRSRVHVLDPYERLIGSVRQRNVFGRIRFDLLDPAGTIVGSLAADSIKAWDFLVADPYGRPVAEVVKSWEGWARTILTKADRYVVRIGEPLPSPLRELTIAAAVSIDVALKQDARGFG